MIKQWSVPECVGLRDEHDYLKRLYGVAVDRLFTVGYQATDNEYRTLRNAVEEARVQAEIAGLNLEKHKLAVHSRAG